MRLLYFILLTIPMSCDKSIEQKEGARGHFLHDGEYQQVEFPIPPDFKFVESTVWFMDPPGHVSYTDSLHAQRIKISPTDKADFLYNRYNWQTNNEEDWIEGMDRTTDMMHDLKAFYLPLKNFYGEDSSSSISLTYYSFWKIDSTSVIKYVEFTKSVQNSVGWCNVNVRKEYTKLNLIEDYKWADSLGKMKIIIKKIIEE